MTHLSVDLPHEPVGAELGVLLPLGHAVPDLGQSAPKSLGVLTHVAVVESPANHCGSARVGSLTKLMARVWEGTGRVTGH